MSLCKLRAWLKNQRARFDVPCFVCWQNTSLTEPCPSCGGARRLHALRQPIKAHAARCCWIGHNTREHRLLVNGYREGLH